MIEQLEVTRSVFSVKDYVSWFRNDQLELRPSFQRLDVWKPKAKSYLIDTVLRGLPFPIIILRDSPGISLESKREVVDGQQRLTALLTYILPDKFAEDKRFTIFKAHAPEFAGKAFHELPPYAQQLLLDYQISTHILPAKVDDQQVLRIFSRLNATGSPLNAQELRNAEYNGAFMTFVFELSLEYFSYWLDWNLFRRNDFARMKEVEFASDLVIRILLGVTGGGQSEIDKVYKDYDDELLEAGVIKERFDEILSEISSGFTDSGIAASFKKFTWFYALFGVVHDALYTNKAAGSTSNTPKKQIDRLFWRHIKEASNVIDNPDDLAVSDLKIIIGSQTNLNARRKREEFLKERVV